LHFLCSQGCWAFLHVSIVHLHFFFWELSVHFTCPFIQWAVDFFYGVGFSSSLYSDYWSLVKCIAGEDFSPIL
jgi:hypothetical protein